MTELYDLIDILIRHQDLIVESYVWGLSGGILKPDEVAIRKKLVALGLISEDERFASDRLKNAMKAVVREGDPWPRLSQTEWERVAIRFQQA